MIDRRWAIACVLADSLLAVYLFFVVAKKCGKVKQDFSSKRGIYWRKTDPPEKGAEPPDWFYVPGVPPKLDGEICRSYVLWREFITPTIALEFASGDGSEERDRTPLSRSTEGQLTNTNFINACYRCCSGSPLTKGGSMCSAILGNWYKPGKFWVYERVMRIPFYGIYEVKNGKQVRGLSLD